MHFVSVAPHPPVRLPAVVRPHNSDDDQRGPTVRHRVESRAPGTTVSGSPGTASQRLHLDVVSVGWTQLRLFLRPSTSGWGGRRPEDDVVRCSGSRKGLGKTL